MLGPQGTYGRQYGPDVFRQDHAAAKLTLHRVSGLTGAEWRAMILRNRERNRIENADVDWMKK